jgi:hypothetical protein
MSHHNWTRLQYKNQVKQTIVKCHHFFSVPISSATLLSTPTDKNPVEVVSNRDQTFSCTTNAARPSSRIEWYLSTINITTSASPQPDVCNTDCSVDNIISSSVLTYTGNINDDGKILYCTAVNIEEREVVRSSNKTIVIWCKYYYVYSWLYWCRWMYEWIPVQYIVRSLFFTRIVLTKIPKYHFEFFLIDTLVLFNSYLFAPLHSPNPPNACCSVPYLS